MNRGVTIIELLLVVALILILGTMSVSFYSRFLTQNAVDNTVTKLVQSFRKAQTYSMSGKQNREWGVKKGSAPSIPVKIDDPGDPGAMQGAGRQVVRTTGGTLYAVINDGGSCEVWKSSDGSSWTEQNSTGNPTCSTNTEVGMAIDSSNNLYIVYSEIVTDDVRYVTFNTSTDTFGATEEIFTTGPSSIYDIAVDSNNIPHAIFWDGSVPKYSNRFGGSWDTTPVTLDSTPFIPKNSSITISEDNIPEVAHINDTDADLTASVGNENDATFFTSQDVDLSVNTVNPVAGASIGVDSSGNTWIAYIDENGATDFVTLAKHDDASSWTTGWTIYTNGNIGLEPSVAINGTDVYVFYEDELDDIKYDKYNGSTWLGETNLQTGTFQDVKTKWSFNFNNQGSTQIDYLFSDGTDIYWSKLNLTSSSNKIILYAVGDSAFDESYSVNGNITLTDFDINFARVTGLPSGAIFPFTINISGNNSLKTVIINSQGVVSRN